MRLIYLILLVIFSTSCKKDKESARLKTYCIEEGIEKVEKMNLSDIAEDIEYIQLETTPQSIIANIRDVLFGDKYILVRDDLQSLILFNRGGKLIRKIGKVGAGPNEFLNATIAILSPNGDKVFVYDGISLKLHVFETKNGEYIYGQKLKFQPSDFAMLNDTTLAFYCSACTFPFTGCYNHIYLMSINRFVVTDSLYPRPDIKEKLTPKLAGNMDMGFVKMYKIDNKLYCWDSTTDIHFYIDENLTINDSYRITSGKYEIPNKYKNDMNISLKKGNSFYVDFLIETENFFFLEGVYNNKYMRNILYDKNTKTSGNIVFNYDIQDKGFHNNIDGTIPFWPKGSIDQNALYDYMSPLLLDRLMSHQYFNEIGILKKDQHQDIINILAESTLTDNPILFIVKLKE